MDVTLNLVRRIIVKMARGTCGRCGGTGIYAPNGGKCYQCDGWSYSGFDRACPVEWWPANIDPGDLYGLPDIAEMLRRPAWHADAACRGKPTEWFFPESKDRVRAQAAALCVSCPVRQVCGVTAVNGVERGTWAGTSENERVEIRRRLRDQRAA